MRYQYFVPKAHPGTLEVAPDDRNVKTKVGLSGNYETIQRIKRQMVNYCDVVLCRNSFSVCVWPKKSVEIEIEFEPGSEV